MSLMFRLLFFPAPLIMATPATTRIDPEMVQKVTASPRNTTPSNIAQRGFVPTRLVLTGTPSFSMLM